MQLESFRLRVKLMRELGMIDPERLGREMAGSFIVETRTSLVQKNKVEIPAVGTLKVNETQSVNFFASAELKEGPKHLLSQFLSKQWRLNDLSYSHWTTIFEAEGQPLSGKDLLSEFGTAWLQHLIYDRKDSKLQRLDLKHLFKGVCYALHDGIRSNSGISLESIGTFYPSLRF